MTQEHDADMHDDSEGHEAVVTSEDVVLPSEESTANVCESEPGVEAEKAPPTASRGSDPVVTVLLTAALSLIAVLLVTGGLVFIYLNTLNEAPRTRVERDMGVWETAVKERPDDVNAWANLAYAYAEAGRIDEALDTVGRAKKVTGRAQFVIVEADVLRLAGRYTEAVDAYDSAEKAVRELQQQAKVEREKVGVKLESDQDALARVYYGRALSRQEIGDMKAALTDLEEAVKLQPQSATLWVALGDLYARSDQAGRARDAYRTALTFVPDEPGALKGLDRIEGGE